MAKSKKPISTIAYDEQVLKDTLQAKLEKDELQFYAYIKHNGEGDGLSECKDHFHVFVLPNTGIDAMVFKRSFHDKDGRNTTINWVPSKFIEWLLYVLHDTEYLSEKGLQRKYHYSLESVVTSDAKDLDRMICENPVPESVRIRRQIQAGYTFEEMFISGSVKPSNACGVSVLKKNLYFSKKENGKDGSKEC